MQDVRYGVSRTRTAPIFIQQIPTARRLALPALGNTVDFDINLVIPDRALSLNEGAIQLWTKPRYRALVIEMKKFARANNIPLDVPFRNLTTAQQNMIIEGEPKSDYVGVNGFFAWLERKKYELHVRVFLSRHRGYAGSARIAHGRGCAPRRARSAFPENPSRKFCAMLMAQAREFMDHLELSAEQAAIADKILEEIRQRLLFLDEVGLEYLVTRPPGVHAFGRRSAAHSTGDFAGIAPGRRAVRAR